MQNAEYGSIANIGTIVNHDRLVNLNNFENINSGTVWSEGDFTNIGTVENSGTIINGLKLDNEGTINNLRLLLNLDTINTDAAGTIINSGKIENCGSTINGSIERNAVVGKECMPVDENPADGDSPSAISSVVLVEDQDFSVTTALTNGVVTDIAPDPAASRLILIVITDPSAEAELTITLPRSLIDAKGGDNNDQQFILLGDNEKADYEETETTDAERVLKVSMPTGASKIVVIGTQVIPEFPLALLALAVTVGLVIVLTTRRLALPK